MRVAGRVWNAPRIHAYNGLAIGPKVRVHHDVLKHPAAPGALSGPVKVVVIPCHVAKVKHKPPDCSEGLWWMSVAFRHCAFPALPSTRQPQFLPSGLLHDAKLIPGQVQVCGELLCGDISVPAFLNEPAAALRQVMAQRLRVPHHLRVALVPRPAVPHAQLHPVPRFRQR